VAVIEGRKSVSSANPLRAEAQLCEAVAEEIVTEYTKLVQRGAAPR
jgi:hypothetical protein